LSGTVAAAQSLNLSSSDKSTFEIRPDQASADPTANHNYTKRWNIFNHWEKTHSDPHSLINTETFSHSGEECFKKGGLYNTVLNLSQEVSSWRKKFVSSSLWSLLLTYPSDLHWNGRVFLITAVTGIVVGKTLEDLVANVDLTRLGEVALDCNFLDGTDPSDPGRVGVSKDFL
jgi:hypothetical protein